MIRHRSKFSSSEFNYALDINSFIVKQHYSEITALWFKKTNGRWTIFEGTVSSHSYQGTPKPVTDLASFLEHYESRWGGNTQFKWDGVTMWSNDSTNALLPQIDAYKRLDPILKEFIRSFEASKRPEALVKNAPNVPAGYTGWFALKEKK